jgi:hypothetical protein
MKPSTIKQPSLATRVIELVENEKSTTPLRIFPEPTDSVTNVGDIPKFALSWSHYLKLMRIDGPDERRFYEIEAAENKYRTILPGKAQLKALIMDNGNRKNSTPACP